MIYVENNELFRSAVIGTHVNIGMISGDVSIETSQ
jgi:hypothetical protein